MSGVATAAIGSTILGSVVSSNASDKASKRALESNQASLDAQERMYQQQRADFAPYQQLGLAALPEYYKMLGIKPTLTVDEQKMLKDYADWQASQTAPSGTASQAPLAAPALNFGDRIRQNLTNPPTEGAATQVTPSTSAQWGGDMEALRRAQEKQQMIQNWQPGAAPELSPLAQWQLMQTQRAQGRADAARGLSGSGGAASREAENAMAIAGQDYQNQYARILDALKIGTGASSAAGGASQQYSSQIGQAGANAGNILMDQGQTQANLWQGLGTLPMDYLNFKNKTQIPSMSVGQFTGGGGSLGAFNANSTVLGGPNGGAMMLPI